MNKFMTIPPAVEPISLAEAKLHLRVDHIDDDALISNLIISCRQLVESHIHMSLIEQVWRWTFDKWSEVTKFKTDNNGKVTIFPASGGHYISLPQKPLIGVDNITTYDTDDLPTAWDLSNIILDKGEGRIYRLSGSSWPIASREIGGIEITFRVGYGVNPTDVPAPIRQAILQMVAHYYQYRDEPAAQMPSTAVSMLRPYKKWRM
jgi:hypothetical protein